MARARLRGWIAEVGSYMRKMLEAISIGSVAALVVLTVMALSGPDRLPGRVAIHFDFSGHANGWGSPLWMLMLPVIGIVLYALLTVVVRFPSAFHYPVQVTAENRPRLEALARDLIAWVKAEVLLNLAWVGWELVEAARHPERGPSFLATNVLPGVIGVTVIWYIRAMFRARGTAGAEVRS